MTGMSGTYKQFDPDLYRETNDRAIGKVLEVLHEADLHGAINDDKYGPDIVVYKGFRPISYIEVEIKRVWSGSEFPWPTIQLPERKAKFLRKRLPMEFWVLNSTVDHAVIIPDYVITKDLLTEVRNVLVPEGELFFQIPIELCIIRSLI